MNKLYALILLLPLCGCAGLKKLVGKQPIQVDAYRTIVGARAFTHSVGDKHPECGSRDNHDHWLPAGNQTLVCQFLDKGISAKDVLIDLTEVYCSSPDFDQNGGSCTPPKEQTTRDALADKIKAAISGYLQTESDLKGVLK